MFNVLKALGYLTVAALGTALVVITHELDRSTAPGPRGHIEEDPDELGYVWVEDDEA